MSTVKKTDKSITNLSDFVAMKKHMRHGTVDNIAARMCHNSVTR